MSQQPQSRPWFRLASLARPTTAPPPPAPAPTPTPTPAPRPPFIRPPFTQTFTQPPPPTQPAQPPPPLPAPTPPTPPQAPIPKPPSPLSPIPQPPATPAPRAVDTLPPTPPFLAKPSSPSPKPSPPSPIPPSSATTTPPPTPPLPITKPSNSSPKPSPPPTLIPTSSVPQSPKPRISAPSSPMPTQLVSPTPSPPPSKAEAASPTTNNNTRVLMPSIPSPQIPKYYETKTPPNKPLTPPPSPLTLPPPVLHPDHEYNTNIPPETEQKIVMVHDNILEKPKTIPSRDNPNNHHSSPNLTKKEKGTNHSKKLSDSEGMGMRVITLAGENRGAIMELTPSQYPRNGQFATNKNGNRNKSWSDGEKLASDSESKMKHNGKDHSGMITPFRSYTNNNIQGVNNSILYNCSCTHNNPGVHLTLSMKPKDHRIDKHHV